MRFLFLILSLLAIAVAQDCKTKGCKAGECCSYWGYCGAKVDYCGTGTYQCVCDCAHKGKCVGTTPTCTNYQTTDSLNCRKGAGTNFAIVKTFAKGATVCVASISNGWAKLNDGNYVSASYIKISGTTPTPTPTPAPAPAPAPATPSCTTKYSTASLNIRTGPGTSYSIWKTIKVGDSVCVVSTDASGWSKLDNGKYASAQYLTTNKPATPSSGNNNASGCTGMTQVGFARTGVEDKIRTAGCFFMCFCHVAGVHTKEGIISWYNKLVGLGHMQPNCYVNAIYPLMKAMNIKSIKVAHVTSSSSSGHWLVDKGNSWWDPVYACDRSPSLYTLIEKKSY